MVVDLVWWWYLACTCSVVLVWGPSAPQGEPLDYLLLQVAMALALVLVRRGSARSAAVGRILRAGFAIVGLPIVFSAMGLVLPAVHPEPYEWTWIAFDHALLGVDPSVALGRHLPAWLIELLTWAYASFYLIPIVTVAVIGWRRGGAAFDRALLTVVVAFVVSYLGYFLWPTLPPYRFLPHDSDLHGIWMATTLQHAIDAGELHRWDCFPSGHTLVSVVCLVLAWRSWRPAFWALLPVVSALVFSTVALRYHYVVDVLAGLALVAPAMGLAALLRRTDERVAVSVREPAPAARAATLASSASDRDW